MVDWRTARSWILPLSIALALAVAVVIVWIFCLSQSTVLLVRHADRNPGEDALNPAGVARAQELVHVATKAGVAAIFRSDTQRARQTAQPLADALGLIPTEIPATDVATLVARIRADFPGRTVLVVGHSNTVPQIIASLGGAAPPDIPENEFDNLFVVNICRCKLGSAKVVNLQYGVVSP